MKSVVTRGALLLMMGLFAFPALPVYSMDFIKVRSGTKKSISNLLTSLDGKPWFQTDWVYHLESEGWTKSLLDIDDPVFIFCPVSGSESWFTVNQVSNTCILYRRINGKTSIVNHPFPNHISCISFLKPGRAVMASFAEVAIFENERFTLLPPVPTHSAVMKILSFGKEELIALTIEFELFRYSNGQWTRIEKEHKIRDICKGVDQTYFITSGFIGQWSRFGSRILYRSGELKGARKLALLPGNSLLITGDSGRIWQFRNGVLEKHSSGCSEDLHGIVVTKEDDIWISGEKGRLLYCGKRKFPPYREENRGFSAIRLIPYGVRVDDEYGVAMTDFTGDRIPDIYVVRIFEQNRFYINHYLTGVSREISGGFFEEAVKREALGSADPHRPHQWGDLKLGIAAADIDNDHDRDIYLCYLNSPNKLLLNTGDGYFRDVSTQRKRASDDFRRSNAAAFADIDLDGDLDLFVTSEEGSNKLFENDGTGHFTDITRQSGLASDAGGMCASFADVDQDSWPDLCVTFWNSDNKLYRNESGRGKLFFRDITASTDLAALSPVKSNGVAFADVNNDGLNDLFIANRNKGSRLYINLGRGEFRDSTSQWLRGCTAMSNGVVFADFDLDGYLDLYLTNVGQNTFFRNEGGKLFMDRTDEFGAELNGYCTGSATGDVDNDGDPDLYVANYINGNSQLFLNITERKTFVKIRLQGVRSNRDATGTKIWIFRNDVKGHPGHLAGYREVTSGSGYGSVSSSEQIFGVQLNAEYTVKVKFPSTHDTLVFKRILAGAMLDVLESEGSAAVYYEVFSSIIRFFINPEIQPEIAKYLMLALLLFLYNYWKRKGYRSIVIIRWIGSVLVYLIFALVNQFFLFSGWNIDYFISLIVAAASLMLLHLLIGRVLMQRVSKEEKMELREKLSRDLHDDLASTLGSISIYANMLHKGSASQGEVTARASAKVAALTQNALQSITDIIWMTSPRNDTLQSLAGKIENYLFDLLSDNGIAFTSAVRLPEIPVILKEEVRNDAFLILKEATHNIIRHAGATHVDFRVETSGKTCTFSLSDDGIGIQASRVVAGRRSGGNGLENIRRRAGESGIDLTIGAGGNGGTEVILRFGI